MFYLLQLVFIFLVRCRAVKNQSGVISIDFAPLVNLRFYNTLGFFYVFIVVLKCGILQAVKIWALFPEH